MATEWPAQHRLGRAPQATPQWICCARQIAVARSGSPDPNRRGGFIDLTGRPLAEDHAGDPGRGAVTIGLHARQQADDQHDGIESELLREIDHVRPRSEIADRPGDRRIELGDIASLKPMGRLIPVNRSREPCRLRPAALLILPRACIIGLGISKASIDGAAALARTRIAVRGVGSATLRVAGTAASWVAASSIRM